MSNKNTPALISISFNSSCVCFNECLLFKSEAGVPLPDDLMVTVGGKSHSPRMHY